MRYARWVLAIVAALTLAGFAATLTRVPAPRNDSQLYASIALAQQVSRTGVPTVLWSSPSAVDHIPFYGPVYFHLQAVVFKLFGVSLASSRVLSLAGALLIALGGAMLARRLSHSPDRALWAFTLLLLTPEIAAMATRGDMAPLAVGFEIMSLAMFVAHRGVACGAFLALAALTTPRTYPFVFAFVASGTVFYLFRPRPSSGRRRFLSATAVVMACLLMWGIASFGSPLRWARFMTVVLTSEDTDVALLRTATRWWQFSWSLIITPLFAVAGAVLAVTSLHRGASVEPANRRAAAFALTVSALAGVLTFAGMNLTFLWGGYFALPLFAVVLALPYRRLPNRAKVLALAVCVLVVFDLGVTALRYARIVATWGTRDPRPIDAMVRAHVPQGAVVFGPDWLYFFSVEGNGARYRVVSEQSPADWTRWVTASYPRGELNPNSWQATSSAERFLIRSVIEELPDRYNCVQSRLIASYRPPTHHLERLGSFGEVFDTGYPETELYKLPRGCPAGVE